MPRRGSDYPVLVIDGEVALSEENDSKEAARSDESRDRKDAGLVFKAAIDGVVTALQVAKPELAPLFAMLGEPAKQVVERFVVRVRRIREERVTYALSTGILRAGISGDEFVSRCEADPRIEQLATNVAVAAQDAVYQGKLEGLALSLASALQDGSRVDEEMLFTSILGQLEPPHIRVLAHMEYNPAGYNSSSLAEIDPGLKSVLNPLFGTLAGLGLIVRHVQLGITLAPGGPENATYTITDFGRWLLERVREVPLQMSSSQS